MKIKFSTLLLFISGVIFGRGTGNIFYPSGLGIAYWGRDTTYYAPDSLKSIWNIKKGNKVYGYSPFGNLVSITEIKQNGEFAYIDTNKKEHIEKKFKLDGICYLYYDDSTLTIAAIGEYNNNEIGENWRFFDRKGRLTERTFPMTLWIRHDYYDTLGKIIREVDYTKCMDKNIEVRDVEYANGQEKVILHKMLIEIFIFRYMAYYLGLFFFLFFSRAFINYAIYTREDEKFPYKQKWFHPSNLTISLYSFWFSNCKPENRRLVFLTNTFTIISFSMFFGWLIIAAINGDLH